MQPFYLYGRMTAGLEQGARACGEIPWLEHYYPGACSPRLACEIPWRDTAIK